MKYALYPTRFECVENDAGRQFMFSVKMFDGDSATVKIKTLVDVACWDEISPLIRNALVQMQNREESL